MRFDYASIDTSPGAHGVLAPPSEFAGGDRDYIALLQSRFADPMWRQHLLILAMEEHGGLTAMPNRRWRGPFVDAARRSLRSLHRQHCAKTS